VHNNNSNNNNRSHVAASTFQVWKYQKHFDYLTHRRNTNIFCKHKTNQTQDGPCFDCNTMGTGLALPRLAWSTLGSGLASPRLAWNMVGSGLTSPHFASSGPAGLSLFGARWGLTSCRLCPHATHNTCAHTPVPTCHTQHPSHPIFTSPRRTSPSSLPRPYLTPPHL
jgi:hypothetical protein